MVAKKTPSPAFEFVVQYLEGKPEAAFREVDDAARQANLKIYPIVYGRAKAHLKLVPTAPRGLGKARRTVAEEAAVADSVETPSSIAVASNRLVEEVVVTKAARPVRRKTAATPAAMSPMKSLETVITKMREGELERERFRNALEQISKIIKSVI